MKYDQLKLSNQLCFPVYATSRLITKEYQPHLEKLKITYPQYLVLMVLWEEGELPVNDIAKKLLLQSNTLTPLLKRMEKQELIRRIRSKHDERKVIINLTEKGELLQEEAAEIPILLAKNLETESISINDLVDLKNKLDKLIDYLKTKSDNQD